MFLRTRQLEDGVAMVVTDLHGSWHAYQQTLSRFFAHHERGEAHRLIFCGDVVHARRRGDDDASLKILHDIMRLQAEWGQERVMLLCGNHEIPHIYGTTLSRGDHEYTHTLEWQLQNAEATAPYKREEVRRFLRGLPFYVWTKAGVTLTHAGAPPHSELQDTLMNLLTFDHDAVLRLADDQLKRYDIKHMTKDANYVRQARQFLAVQNNKDPRLTELLRGQLISQTSEAFGELWSAFFGHNESDSGFTVYLADVESFLAQTSTFSPYPQAFLVAGHVTVRAGGYQWVGEKHLRIASYAHATPLEKGRYLLFDCGAPVKNAKDLEAGLRPLFN